MRFLLINIFQAEIQPSFGGRKFIDLLTQYRTEEGKIVSTKVGVRYPVQIIEDIKGVLDASTEMSNNLKRESAKMMNFSKIALIEREIEDLRMLRYNCQGVSQSIHVRINT